MTDEEVLADWPQWCRDRYEDADLIAASKWADSCQSSAVRSGVGFHMIFGEAYGLVTPKDSTVPIGGRMK